MTNMFRSSVVVIAFGLGLAACGDNNTPASTIPQVPTPTPMAKVEDQFGSCFATRYRADPFSKATDPVPCPDLPAVSATTKPAQI